MFGFIVLRSLFRLFFQLSLYGQQQGNFSLLLLESYRLSGEVFCENSSKFPTLYMDIYNPFCGGVFEDFLYPPHYYWKVLSRLWGCFKKKFIKISHKMVSRFFQSPSIYVRKFSLHLCFWAIFLSYNCYYRKFVSKIYRLIGVIATASLVSICLFLSYELTTINSTQLSILSKSDLPKKFLN